MKKSLASIEIRQIVKELQSLIGSKLDTIYHPKEGELYLLFHITGEGKKILKIISGKFFYITSSRPIAGEPSGFCLLLRKHIDNARVKEIRQLESERIVAVTFEKEEQKKLYIELFGRGNIILCDKDNNIIGALSYPSFKDREIKAKKRYEYPKMKLNLFSMSEKEFASLLKASSLALVKCLAIEVGMGGPYAEEICRTADIPKDTAPSSLTAAQQESIFRCIRDLLSKNPSPIILLEGGEAQEVLPFPLKVFQHLEQKVFSSYLEALERYFTEYYKEPVPLTAKEKELERIKSLIGIQEKHLKELEGEEAAQREKAESIYLHYSLLMELAAEVKASAEKHGWGRVQSLLDEVKILKKINPKEKTIDVDL
ncbi:NFACT family protein [Candidatus Woesearchaeota archaeon]|nr:NFACT family protein [Candidatus Woesearchaeota archaeon]